MVVSQALAAVGLAAACAGATIVAGDVEETKPVDARPNVVVLYIDDVNPNTTWLWGRSDRTPSLAAFRDQGVEFRNAVGSTPLCGPSRATLLTGQYGHTNGVTGNRLGKFDPGSTLATKLKDVGYYTILGGKYGNGIERAAPTRESVRKYAEGWSKFDVIWKRQNMGEGQFYGYWLWTKDRVKEKGHRPQDHSTFVTGTRVAEHIRKAPSDRPLFALASLSSGHWPNTPLAWHRGSAACSNAKPYRSPSFNEPDVSDKPAYIRSLPRLDQAAFGLRTRCEEMLGVDAALARIRKALQETGRLENTLLLFTADNGYLMGDHRIPHPGGKKWPHSVPVPMYALWPAELGNRRRVVREPVSNVDIPVTICSLAGCSLDDADGVSILPLLDGTAGELDREFLYLEMLRPWDRMPPWYGLVTTRAFSTGATWHYTEYSSGARELYDLDRDPYRLNNVVRKPWQANRVKRLHAMLHREVVEPDDVRFP